MMHLKSTKSLSIFIILFFVTNSSFSQDTLSIYFYFGSSKLKKSEQLKLDDIQENYYFEDIQKVYFIGYSDSVGNVAANISLSEKRAKTVYKYCKSILPENMDFSIEAKGEINLKRTAEASRRVDVVFEYKTVEELAVIDDLIHIETPKIDTLSTKDSLITTTPKELCHYIDYPFLHSSRQQIITNRNKEYVVIETKKKYIKKQQYYYQHYNKRTDKWEVKKVRWRTQTTGQLWWRKQRINTKIELKDYNKSKLFQRVPMDSCHSCNANNLNLYEETKCLQVDSFLLLNAQYKLKLRKGTVKVRVPREYVNIEDNYYIGCGKQNKINWEKKRFGRNKKYYFTELNVNVKTLSHASITREMDCCKEAIIPCIPAFSAFPSGRSERYCIQSARNRLSLDVGTLYLFESHKPYIGLGYTREFKSYTRSNSNLTVRVGVTNNTELFNKIEYYYYVYSFAIMGLNSSTSWSNFDNFMPKYESRIFVGTSVNSLHDLKGTNQFFSEAHLGINFKKFYPRYLSNIYFLSGGSYNFIDTENQFGLYFELGVSVNLYSD